MHTHGLCSMSVGVTNRHGEKKRRIYSYHNQHPASRTRGKSFSGLSMDVVILVVAILVVTTDGLTWSLYVTLLCMHTWGNDLPNWTDFSATFQLSLVLNRRSSTKIWCVAATLLSLHLRLSDQLHRLHVRERHCTEHLACLATMYDIVFSSEDCPPGYDTGLF